VCDGLECRSAADIARAGDGDSFGEHKLIERQAGAGDEGLAAGVERIVDVICRVEASVVWLVPAGAVWGKAHVECAQPDFVV
jgi:hypothetical protein